jgi:lipopolysaccharide assembly outer membrane protein LptD (OstA)
VLAAAVPGLALAQVPARPPVQAPTRAPRPAARDTAARGDSARRATAGATGIGGQNADTARARRDTAGVARAGADSARADTALITWAAEDSTFTALRARAGYDAVRYQGDTVRFRADQRVLTLRGKPAAVERGPTVLVGNTVRYDDSLQVVTAGVDSLAAGDSVVLRDPSQGSDVIVRGGIRYDLSERRGTVSGFNTAVAQGETWFVRGGRGAFATDSALADSAGGGRIFYAHQGAVTSCDETEPHYHFVARDIKLVSKRLLVIRPATLYIGNVPVLWLPFVFQDTRPGRRSGLLRPLFGVAELLRNSPSYQRSIRNLGYYTTIGDYADVKTWLDYRSGARPGPFGVGLLSFNAESRYKNIDRFIDGNVAVAYDRQSDGARNARVSWQHAQAFNQDRRFTANVNLTQNTQVQRRNQFNLGQVLGTISSSVNLQDKFGRCRRRSARRRSSSPAGRSAT